MEKTKRDIISSAILLVFGIFMIVYAIPTQIDVGSILGASSGVDSRWFPNVVSILICVISSIVLIGAIIKYSKQKKEESNKSNSVKTKEKFELSGEIKALVVFALFIAYAFAFKIIGFIPATIIFPSLVLMVMGAKKIKYYISFLIVAAITYSLFVFVLGITIR